eukprot:NODE_74_length_23402_cov_1.166974.p1 type:complete len:4329 gc:universal NODE_74_length_23402_cov_1.166974:19649-6663(-)
MPTAEPQIQEWILQTVNCKQDKLRKGIQDNSDLLSKFQETHNFTIYVYISLKDELVITKDSMLPGLNMKKKIYVYSKLNGHTIYHESLPTRFLNDLVVLNMASGNNVEQMVLSTTTQNIKNAALQALHKIEFKEVEFGVQTIGNSESLIMNWKEGLQQLLDRISNQRRETLSEEISFWDEIQSIYFEVRDKHSSPIFSQVEKLLEFSPFRFTLKNVEEKLHLLQTTLEVCSGFKACEKWLSILKETSPDVKDVEYAIAMIPKALKESLPLFQEYSKEHLLEIVIPKVSKEVVELLKNIYGLDYLSLDCYVSTTSLKYLKSVVLKYVEYLLKCFPDVSGNMYYDCSEFIKRLEFIQEVVESQSVYCKLEKIELGGIKNEIYNDVITKSFFQYNKSFEELKSKSCDLLDIGVSTCDYLDFFKMIYQLDRDIASVIKRNCDEYGDIWMKLRVLEVLESFLKRPAVLEYLINFYIELFEEYHSTVQSIFYCVKSIKINLHNVPPVMGYIVEAYEYKRKLEELTSTVTRYVVLDVDFTVFINKCSKMIEYITTEIGITWKQWHLDMEDVTSSNLKVPLLCSLDLQVEKQAFLSTVFSECKTDNYSNAIKININSDIIVNMHEIRLFIAYKQQLQFELMLPDFVTAFYKKSSTIQNCIRILRKACNAYNNIILPMDSMSQDMLADYLTIIAQHVDECRYTMTWDQDIGDLVNNLWNAIDTCIMRYSLMQQLMNLIKLTTEEWMQHLLLDKDVKKCITVSEIKERYSNIEMLISSSFVKFNSQLENIHSVVVHSDYSIFHDYLDELLITAIKEWTISTLKILLENTKMASEQVFVEVIVDVINHELVLMPNISKTKNSIYELIQFIVDQIKNTAKQITLFRKNGEVNVYDIIMNSFEVKDLESKIVINIDKTQKDGNDFKHDLVVYQFLYNISRQSWIEKTLKDDKVQEELDKLQSLQVQIKELRNEILINGWIKMDMRNYKNYISSCIKKTIGQLLNQYESDFNVLVSKYTSQFNEQMELLKQDLNADNYSLLIDKIRTINQISAFDKTKQHFFDQMENTISVLKGNNIASDGVMNNFKELKEFHASLNKIAFKTNETILPLKVQVIENIESKLKRLHRKVLNFREDFLVNGPYKYNAEFKYSQINDYQREIGQLLIEKQELVNVSSVLEIEVPRMELLDACLFNLRQLKSVWDFTFYTLTKFEHYRKMQWKLIDVEYIEQFSKDLLKDLKKMDKDVKAWPIFTFVEKYVKDITMQITIIGELKSPFIKQRHWDQLMVLAKVNIIISDKNSLQDLLLLQLHHYEDDVRTIIDKSNKEQSIQKVLNDVNQQWQLMNFVFEKSSNAYIAKMPDNLVECLEDNQLMLQNLLNSKNIDYFKSDIVEWQNTLGTVDSIITILNTVQTTWCHLQTIFSQSEDIKKQLPDDTLRFHNTSEDFIALMTEFHVTEKTGIIDMCNTPNLLDKLEGYHYELQKCEKALSDYLETKRLVFPRFYFISSADLLDILSNGNCPRSVSSHLSKLFDNLCDLEFVDATENCSVIKGMYSREKEYVEFQQPLVLKGAVEHWLCDIENEMKKCLKYKLNDAIAQYDERPREKWILEHCSQLALAGTQLFWTSEVNMAFIKMEEGNEMAMKDLYKKQCVQLTNLITLIQGTLSKNDRTLVMTICTLDVHARDVVSKLIMEKATNAQCWSWQSQLRIRWDDDEKDCLINICDAKFRYNYEYLGNTARLVVTPLTDRCYITLSQALHLKLGGSPQGPAGTGKTETVKDLGKAMAIMVYVFNCSEQMDYQSVGNIYKGLAQSGSWGCFDEFNRISVEVLSVIATQVKSIQDALRAKKQRFNFLGEDIKLKQTVGIWITMNPGYAGRAELPDNLKALFRPCSMVVPNLELIMEIMLMAEGFTSANLLARKFNTLYKLNRELLSKQDHYDWGLRAIKSVLVVAGSLKRSEPNTTPEDQVLMRALRDFNVPKIVLEDVPIFMGLIADLFPKLEVLRKRDHKLETEIRCSALELNLQPEDSFILKVVQLEELLQVRHCVFILGDAATGKSKVWKTLFRAYHKLNRKCQFADLDPKAVTNDELFGFMNPSTREWKDGLFSTVMRDFSNGNNDSKWILLDGDIDPMWIESLNTVMDDNKVLTLASNERIPLKDNMRLIFEIGDLKYATPATVSRAGILYISQNDVSMNAIINSWIQKREDANERAILSQLFERYVAACLEFIKKVKHCDILPFNMINTLFRFLDHFLTKPFEKEVLEGFFAFSCVWAFGGTIMQDALIDYRLEFSKMFKQEFNTVYASDMNVFDYFYDQEKKRFVNWEQRMFTAEMKDVIFDTMIPITETIRQYYLLDILIGNGHPTLLVGMAGVGKTCLIKQKLQQFTDTHNFVNIPFNYYTNSTSLQPILEKPLEKKVGKTYGPVGNKKLIYFIDDLNMPEVDKYGTVSCHTLLRQQLDYNHWYDRSKMQLKDIVNCQYICAMNPTSGNFTISKRLQRHFSIFVMNAPSDDDLNKIYSNICVGQINQSFTVHLPKIVNAVLSIHKKISTTFLPTAVKFHYIFNMREISSVFQGILAADSEMTSTLDLANLIQHECQRVYGDRMMTKEDVDSYARISSELINKEFNEKIEPNLFSKFAKGLNEGKYLKTTVEQSRKILEEGLNNYNEINSQMNLVLFEDAIKHVCRINRVLEFNRGNIVLVGVGGSGKQSLSKLASYLASRTIYQISLKKGYGIADFKLDLAQLFMKCGLKKQQITFLITESHLIDERMLIVINDFLASGDVPQLFPDEEVSTITNAMRSEVKQMGLVDNSENCWTKFIDNVKLNLRLIICLSPVGDKLRRRCRRFPALMSSTYLNWFHGWPQEALFSVAMRFLSDIELVPVGCRETLAKFMCYWQTTCDEVNKKYLLIDKRYNYATPKSFLEYINLFKLLLERKSSDLTRGKERLENGLSKLKSTSEQVDILKSKLADQEVELKIKNENAEKLIATVAENTEKVNYEKKLADEEEKKVQEFTIVVEEKKRLCEQDLKAAEPALAAASDALNTLNKSNLTELKSFGSPSQEVQDVVAAVIILLSPSGKIVKDKSWKACKAAMANVDRFLDSLVNFNKEDINQNNLDALKPYLQNPDFTADFIKSKSQAAAGLCGWVVNIVIYYHVFCDVEPKRIALKESSDQLNHAQTKLQQVKSKVMQLDNDLIELRNKFEKATSEKLKCEHEAQKTQETLGLADRLVNGLSSERLRWGEAINMYSKLETTLVGDVLLSAAFLASAGPFTKLYRRELLDNFKQYLKSIDIMISDDFDLIRFLSNDADVSKWQNEGLPRDPVSIENALMYTNSSRWCLFIDPQLQCINWLKSKLPDALLISIGSKGYLDKIEKCISEGLTCILEDVSEQLDPILDNIISNNKIKKNKYYLLGDKDVEIHSKFKLILQTRLPNPHYTPEVQAQTCIINFTVTIQGLEDQLLADVVNVERSELEKSRAELTRQQNEFKIKLLELEDNLLFKLSSAQGNFLGDTTLVENLESTKRTAIEIEFKVKEAFKTEIRINEIREIYRPVADRSSMLYFLLNSMWVIHPMYQYSLKSFKNVFFRAISKAETAEEVKDRVKCLIECITFEVFSSTSRGLFENDKLIFVSQLVFNIMLKEQEIDAVDLDYLLRCPRQVSTCPIEWINDGQWQTLKALTKIDALKELCNDLEQSNKRWKKYCELEQPENEKLPSEWKNRTAIQQLCILRALRPDRILYGLRQFISTKIGDRYVNGNRTPFGATFQESSAYIPIFFILSPGVDPVKDVEQIGKTLGISTELNNFYNISLGQGQEIVAERALDIAIVQGGWVMLQNIHLVAKWLPTLEKKMEEIFRLDINVNFRLFLSAEPAGDPLYHIIPTSILQQSIKITNEAPTGMKANLHKALDNFDQEILDKCSKELEFKSILFALCYFHAVVVERKKFGAIGWNRSYPFNNGDLTISVDVLFNYLESFSKIPWDDIRYIFGEIMYGGHISDDLDRRLCATYLQVYVREELFDTSLLYCANFNAPPSLDYNEYHRYIDENLPLENPLLYGMHPNAEISVQTITSEKLFMTMMELQPKESLGQGKVSKEELLRVMIEEMIVLIPEVFGDMSAKIEDKTPFTSVCLQECDRMSKILTEMKRSLIELLLGLNGDLSTTDLMEQMMQSLHLNKIPENWIKMTYPSSNSLNLWFVDLLNRYKQLEGWISDFNVPICVNLSWLFNPQAFLTAVMQTTARRNEWPLDKMTLNIEVLKKTREEIIQGPRDGIYMDGLYLEGARYENGLTDSRMKELYFQMPVIHVKAVTVDKADMNGYPCPIYKTKQRGPTYIWTLNLKSKDVINKWILGGVAMLLSQ